MMGGITPDAKPADETTRELAAQFKQEAAKKLQVDTFEQWDVVEYKTQVVAGINYFIKVQSGQDEAVHLRIWDQPWTSTRQLSDVKAKKLSDPIEYF
jgi:cystatin-A/B